MTDELRQALLELFFSAIVCICCVALVAMLMGCAAHGALFTDPAQEKVLGPALRLEVTGFDPTLMSLTLTPKEVVPPVPDDHWGRTATLPPALVAFVASEAPKSEPPEWLVRNAASRDPTSVEMLRYWQEIRGKTK